MSGKSISELSGKQIPYRHFAGRKRLEGIVSAPKMLRLRRAAELANYGEYSGDPTLGEIRNYASTILSLMTQGAPRPDGKLLFIGGAIANFIKVGETFQGIIELCNFALMLQAHKISIYDRRSGPKHELAQDQGC
ncbi:unnamed protein product, partial [Mesorhabditis belari]|uniref:ATP-citrate synthase citrate-binding domain-containing protein n=1 Tax=Mesorhabditis belari TaxID=2138241 RepID=A0AAF3J8U8_9BILA